MKSRTRQAVLTAVLCLFVSFVRGADSLEDEANQIDAESSAKTTTRPEDLSQQFGVPVEKVNAMRAEGKGWGAITIELALAQELAMSDPETYPTVTPALAKVELLRAQKMGYGKIARELGMKVGPVIRAARHERNQLRRDSRRDGAGARPEKPPKPERMEKPARNDRPYGGNKRN